MRLTCSSVSLVHRHLDKSPNGEGVGVINTQDDVSRAHEAMKVMMRLASTGSVGSRRARSPARHGPVASFDDKPLLGQEEEVP